MVRHIPVPRSSNTRGGISAAIIPHNLFPRRGTTRSSLSHTLATNAGGQKSLSATHALTKRFAPRCTRFISGMVTVTMSANKNLFFARQSPFYTGTFFCATITRTMLTARNTNIVASFLVLQRGTKVLLLKRAHTGYHDGDYSLIAGHVEQGETFTDAIIREAKEEAGIVLSPTYLKVAHVMHRKSDFDLSERVDVYFLAKKWKGSVCNREPKKCSELRWFEISHLPLNTIASVKKAIEYIAAQVPYSEFGW